MSLLLLSFLVLLFFGHYVCGGYYCCYCFCCCFPSFVRVLFYFCGESIVAALRVVVESVWCIVWGRNEVGRRRFILTLTLGGGLFIDYLIG